MKLFGNKKPQIKGEIGYFGLADWWLATFTEQERVYIESTYSPMMAGFGVGANQNKNSLTQGNILSSGATIAGFLSGLSSWFTKTAQDRDISRRILSKSIEATDPQKDILGLHFSYQGLIETWYRDRENLSNALDETIKACQTQIAIAPRAAKQFKKEFPASPLPSHVGYTQLTIIYDKQGLYDEAIRVAQQAKKQHWNGDWDARIERYEKKKAKQKQNRS